MSIWRTAALSYYNLNIGPGLEYKVLALVYSALVCIWPWSRARYPPPPSQSRACATRFAGKTPVGKAAAETRRTTWRQNLEIKISTKRLKWPQSFDKCGKVCYVKHCIQHVHVASDTQMIWPSDWSNWRCALWRYLTSCLLLDQMSFQMVYNLPKMASWQSLFVGPFYCKSLVSCAYANIHQRHLIW